MLKQKTKIESVLNLSAQLVQKKAFTIALKERKPQEELRAIHSNIQDLQPYNLPERFGKSEGITAMLQKF